MTDCQQKKYSILPHDILGASSQFATDLNRHQLQYAPRQHASDVCHDTYEAVNKHAAGCHDRDTCNIPHVASAISDFRQYLGS